MTAIDFAAFVDELATVSGDAILPFFRTSLGVEDKGSAVGFDPVTQADRAAENAMRGLIKRNFPEHGIVGEEYGNERTDAEYVWVLDPIDGTKSFISGMPAWGSLIALTRNGEAVFGMMHQPFIRERFSGDGGAARYRGPAGERKLMVRPCAGLGDAVLFTTSPLLMNAEDRAAYARVGGRGAAAALRRRLLCLLHARGRTRRSGDRNGTEAARHRRADPDRRGRGWRDHKLGGRQRGQGRARRRGRRQARA